MEYLVYFAPLAVYLVWSIAKSRAAGRRSDAAVRDAGDAVPDERRVRQPRIDAARCVGCGACIVACPEHARSTVLGLVAGKAVLVSPQSCRGHEACRAACPSGAITLEFA